MPPKKRMKMEDIPSFFGKKSIATSCPVREKEENDDGYEDQHKHPFTVEFSKDDKYTINCDQPCTVLEAIKSKNKAKMMITREDENIIIQMGTGEYESIVPTHFPCTLIRDHESLIIKSATKQVETHGQDYKIVHPKDQYSVFYVDTKGGKNAKTKKLFRNNKIKGFKYLRVYGEKGITVEEALKRDGRFIDDLGYFELMNISDDCKTVCTDVIDNLDNNKFQICLPQQKNAKTKDANQQTDCKQEIQLNPPLASNISQRSRETKSLLALQKETGGKLSTEKIHNRLRELFPHQMEWMENTFPGDSYQKALNLRKGDFGKIQNCFSELHRVRELLELARSVCLLQMHISASSTVQGTGFVLFDNVVLTNAHLFKYWVNSNIPDWHKFVKVTTVFNFEKQYSKINKIKAKVMIGNNGLDYAILELETEEEIPPGLLKRFGPLPPDGGACIVGHPKGEVKKMDPTCIIEKEKREEAVNKNLQAHQESIFTLFSVSQLIKNDPYENVIGTYTAYMYHSLTGSPVFDVHGQVFGLHSGGFMFEFTKPNESVIEFAFPLLTIFRDLVANLKKNGPEKLLERVEEEAKGNPHLENIIASVVGPKQSSPE